GNRSPSFRLFYQIQRTPLRSRPLTWTAVVGVVTNVVLLTALPLALAQESPGMSEMRTAEQQAAAAAGTQDLPQVKAHLQQALNCRDGRGASAYRLQVG